MAARNSEHFGFVDPAAAEARIAEVQFETQLATWMSVANGAALLFCLNAMLDHKVCDWNTFRPLASIFAFGLVCAFASAVAARIRQGRLAKGLVALSLNMTALDIAEEAVEDAETNKKPAHVLEERKAFLANLRAASKELPSPLSPNTPAVVANLTLTVSATAFAIALTWALLDDRYIAALCTPAVP